jgi:ATP-dependent DNA helicase RecG
MHNVEDIINSIRKPIIFASKDNFSHIGALKGLEGLVNRLCVEVRSINPSHDLLSGFDRLRLLFTGFDDLPTDEKKEVITRAALLVNGISGGPGGGTAVPAAFVPPEEVKKNLKELSRPLEYVKGIGPKLAERLGKKGLKTVEDLLYYLPIRYEDRTAIKRIRDLTPGLGETVIAEVLACGEVRYGRRRVYEIAVGDGSGILKLKWFNFRPAYMKRYKQGHKYVVFGTVTEFGRALEMIHPDMELYDAEEGAAAGAAGGAGTSAPSGIVPVYSQIENLHQKTIRKIVRSAVETYAGLAAGGVPVKILKRHGLLTLPEAIKEAHLPGGTKESGELARTSLAFDELFMLEIGLALKRGQVKKEPGISLVSTPPAEGGGRGLEARLRGLLPFSLTNAQERTLGEIFNDMRAPHPMNRLIQGDVGSGKTIVSLLAALRAIEAGYQAAIMAPTEILAEQHYLTTHKYAEAVGIRVALLTGNLKRSARKEALASIQAGEIDLVIGTHALIQKDVEFNALGLAVIDEQHRFGVMQRAALKRKGAKSLSPDILIMTATPIPRTMSMTVFGDLDVSTIDELPPGRLPVRTRILREKDRARAYDMIKDELDKGAQVYIVYPLVEESEELPLKDATNMAEHLDTTVFRDYRVGLLHGRMKSVEKEEVMRAFKGKELDILVATTVIEVGVDVPNASVILVEHAERFGLAQLHQLRGRVGRGERSSVCLLLAQWTSTEDTLKRLKVMEATEDGFRIAEEDLKLRGPGDFIGTRQAGFPDFRIAGALGNLNLLKKAREEAFRFVSADPGLKGAAAAPVKEVLKARWEGRLELAEIG